MFSFFVFASIFISTVTADDPYNCGGGRLINPPLDLSEPYYWPNNWNESMQPATYAGSQNCNWQINVLQGSYATVTFYKDTDSESGITCTYPNGDTDYIEDKELNSYIFTNPQFQVNLRVSDKQGMFSFKVVWSKYPSTCKMDINLDDKKGMAVAPTECLTTITAPNHVFFVPFTLQDDLYVLLRQAIIFNGDSVNSSYIGNLNSARYRQIVSSGNKLTIFTLPAVYRNFNYTLYMGMDTNAAGDIQQMTGVNCPSNPATPCYITINSEQTISAVATVIRQTDYIQPFLEFPAGATLNVYESQVNDAHLLTSMTRSNFMNQLPLGVKDVLKIYRLDSGRVSFPITRNATIANNGAVYDGRVVRIHSFDHGMTSFYQDTNEVYQTTNNEKLYFKFNVKDCNFNTQTTLDVQVTRDGQNVFSQTFTATNPPPTYTLKVYGDKMSVNYQTFGNYTTGFQIDLTTTRNDDISSSPATILPITSTMSPPTRPSTSNPRFSSTSSPITNTASSSILTTSPKALSDSPTTNGPLVPSGATTTLGATPPTVQTTTFKFAPGATTPRYESTTKVGIDRSLFVSLIFCISYFLWL